jgi:hypothetical protein
MSTNKRQRRAWLANLAALAALAVLVQACASAAPSASPTGSSPSGTPAGSAEPGPSGTPGPDHPATPHPSVLLSVDGYHQVSCEDPPPDGSRPEPYSLACEATFSVLGDDVPWWTVPLRGPCGEWATARDMTLFVACDAPDGFEIHAFQTDGRPVHGWPVQLPGSLAELRWNDFESGCGRQSPAILGDVGTVFVATSVGGRIEIHGFYGDGIPLAGWPQPLPGDAGSSCAGFALADDGTLRTWGYEDVLGDDEWGLGYTPFASRTVFSALEEDGRTLPGWPIGSTGAASGPLISPNETLYYVSATGRVWAHDDAGEVWPGWPHLLPELARPYLRSDGRPLFVLTDSAYPLTFEGRIATGWPYHPPSPRQSRCFPGEVDCFGLVEAELSVDGTLYLSLEPAVPGRGGSVVALDHGGAVVPGWPYELPDGSYATRIETLGTRFVSVEVTVCDSNGCRPAEDSLLLGTNGEPVY